MRAPHWCLPTARGGLASARHHAASPKQPRPAPSIPASAIEGAYEHDALASAGHPPRQFPATASRPATPNQYSSPLDFRRVAIALGIVLGLVFVCRWAARWMFPSAAVGRSSQVMKVLSRSVIAPKQQLLLIQVGRRLVLVGDCGQQMNALAEISDPDEVAGLLGQLRAGAAVRSNRAIPLPRCWGARSESSTIFRCRPRSTRKKRTVSWPSPALKKRAASSAA
jgi:flagellar biogenesis protein FliO